MHGILTLYDQIKTGEITKRRDESAHGGAAIQIEARDGVPVAP